MEPYALYFLCLSLFVAGLAYHQKGQDRDEEDLTLALPKDVSKQAEARRFKREYFTVYFLVVSADWIQGPFMYTLYKDEKMLSEAIVASLFTTGFVSAGITASFVGSLADRHGRRLACLVFCAAYSLSCLSVVSDVVPILFIGRALGGLSTTLLYSVFETWMIAEYQSRRLGESDLTLGYMFSQSVTYSGIVAIVAGFVGEAVVSWSGTKTAPFLLAVVCLTCAAGAIRKNWAENYGQLVEEEKAASSSATGVQTILLDKKILALGLATTVFEGSMYLFVFFWSPALRSARSAAGITEAPPFGLIFSCFMSAMMLGSMIFSGIDLKSVKDTGRLLLGILTLAANCLLVPVLASSEMATFWGFTIFEVCVGMYFPAMGRLKSELVDDAVRARVYGVMRLPLNLFVVLALGLTQEGDAYRNFIFTATGSFLLGAFLVVQRCLI
ncbi:Molybdate-anion transporter [Sphaerulina musiva]